MIYVRLKGGMGNQMFQYAYGRSLANRLETELVLDLSALLNRNHGPDFVYRNYDLSIFMLNTKFSFSPTILRSLYKVKNKRLENIINRLATRKKTIIREPHFHYAQNLIDKSKSGQLHIGWFQSPKYFSTIEEEIRKDFQFKASILDSSRKIAEKIASTNSICLNVRRTDFINDKALNATNLSYFLEAADLMAKKVENPCFFIFSDDIEWCRENLHLPFPTEIIGHEHKGKKFGNYLHLMTLCKHFIIPNSSFAWWAAWLSQQSSKKIVITPDPWFAAGDYTTNDLIPDNWIRFKTKSNPHA